MTPHGCLYCLSNVCMGLNNVFFMFMLSRFNYTLPCHSKWSVFKRSTRYAVFRNSFMTQILCPSSQIGLLFPTSFSVLWLLLSLGIKLLVE